MKLGLYRHQLNRDHYRFAKQCGCAHLVIHLVDYLQAALQSVSKSPIETR